jgi:hypothetical protein
LKELITALDWTFNFGKRIKYPRYPNQVSCAFVKYIQQWLQLVLCLYEFQHNTMYATADGANIET